MINYTHPKRGKIVLTGNDTVVVHRAPSLVRGESIALPRVARFNPENVPADQRPAHVRPVTGGIDYRKRGR